MNRPKSAYTARVASAKRSRQGIDLSRRPDLSRFLTKKAPHDRSHSADFKLSKCADLPVVFKPKEDPGLQPSEKFKNAYRLRAEGLFEAAEGVYMEVLKDDPKCLPARLNLGVCLMKLGRFTEAARIYKDSGVYMTDPRLAYNLVLCLLMTFSYEEAKLVLQSLSKTPLKSEATGLIRYVETKTSNPVPTEASFLSEMTADEEEDETAKASRSFSKPRPKTGYKDVSASTADRSDEPGYGMWKIFKSVEQYGGSANASRLAKPIISRKPPRAKSARAKVEFSHPKSSFLTAAKVTRQSDSSTSGMSFDKGISPDLRHGDEAYSPVLKRVHVVGPVTQEDLEDVSTLKSAVPSRRQENSVFSKLSEAHSIIDAEERKLHTLKNLLPNVDVDSIVKDRLSVSALEFIRKEMAKDVEKRDYATMIGMLTPLKFFAKFQKEVRVQILKACVHRLVAAEEYVYRQKEPGDVMYIVLAGSVVIEKKSGEYGADPITLHTIFDGETFGEVNLLTSSEGFQEEPRSSSIRTLEETDLLGLGKHEYHHLMMSQMHTDIDSKIRFFATHPLFNGAQRLNLVPLVTNIDVTCYRFGHPIIEAGCVPNTMFLIYSGLCQIYADGYSLRPRTEGRFAKASRRPHPKFATGNTQFTAIAKPPEQDKSSEPGNMKVARSHFRNINMEKVLKDHYFVKERTRLETLQPGDFFCGRCLTTSGKVAPAKYTIVAESAEVQVYVLTQVHLGFLGENLEVIATQRQFKAVAERKGDVDCPQEVSKEDIDEEFMKWNKYKRELIDNEAGRHELGKRPGRSVHIQMANSLSFSETTGRLWDRTPTADPTGQLLRVVPPQKQRYQCAAFSPSGEWFALCDSRGNLVVVDLAKNRYKTTARGCNGASAMCVLGGDPEEIAVACSSNCVFVYQTTGRLQGTLKGHRSKISQVVANAPRGMLLTCSEDACILWHLSNWSRLRSLFGEKNGFTSALFTPSGRSILTCFSHGELYQWSLHDFSLEKTLTHAPGLMFTAITVVHCSSGDYYAAAGFDAKLILWEADGPAAPVGTVSLQSQKVSQLVTVHGGKVVVLGSAGGVEVADVRTRSVAAVSVGDAKAASVYADVRGERIVVIDAHGSARLFLGPNASQEAIAPRPVYSISGKSSVSKTAPNDQNDEAEVQIMSDKERSELEQVNPSELRLKDLRNLLQKYGEFPDKYRLSIWQTVLQLPNNEDSFAKLAGKGIHPAYCNLNERYPIKSQKLFAQLQRTLSAVSYWSPVFAEAEVLPGIAFPIVALAGGQEVVCFELIACLFLNWLQHWFEFFPNPPVSYIQACQLVLSRLDSQLASHLQALTTNPGQVFWPLLSSLLTEVLTKEEWIVMMDHLVMEWEQPLLLLHFVTQYLLSYKSTLLSIRSIDDLCHFLHKQNPGPVVKLMRKARAALQRLDLNRDLPVQFARRVPLLQGMYPTFTGYPQFEVNFQAEVRARIRQEADEALRKQNYLDDLTSHMNDLEEKERQYRSQQEALMQLDHDRRTAATLSTAASLEEKRQMDQELRSRRLQQLRQVQSTIEQSLDSQLDARKAELMRLEQEIANRRQQDQYFLEKKIQDEAVARLEFQSAQKLYELTRGRAMDDEQRKIREEIDVWKREQELKERLLHEQWALEDEERRLKLETIKERKLKEMEALTLANDRKKLEMQQQIQELEKEVRAQDVIRERKLRTIQEEEALRTAEALEKLTKAQTVVQQEEQMHFKTILAEERRAAERKTKERLELLEMERRKQLGEMQELDTEIMTMQKRQQRIEVEDRLAELRHEQEMKTLAEERQVQDMLLRIDEERRVKTQLEREMRMKEEELREKTEFQQVLRETEDRVLREERARFEEQRSELRHQQEEEESAKANAHNLKMETIIREREKQLLELTQARRQPPRLAPEAHFPLPEAHYPLPEEARSRSAQVSRVEESRSRAGEDHKRDSPSYRDDLLHDTFSRNDDLGRFARAEDNPSTASPPGRSLSPGEEGERLVSHHDSEHRDKLRHVSSPGSYSVSSSYASESSHVESYSSEVSGTPPLPDHYESSYSSELSSHTNSVTESSGMSWSRSERSPTGQPVRRSHYY